MKKDYYKKDSSQVIKMFNSSLNGLASSDVSCNQKKYGMNVIEEKKPKSKISVFIDQFKNLLVIILILASILSLLTGGLENTIVILSVLIINAFLGSFQYFKAEKSINALKKLSKTKAVVYRDNQNIVIDDSLVVCGDIIVLKRGDIVSCDCRIIECNNLEVDESILTGESTTTQKHSKTINDDKTLFEQKNCLFRGSKIISGKAKAVCYAVGVQTEIGQIFKMMQNIKAKKSPLEVNIDKFSHQLAFLIIAVCISVFLLNIYRKITFIDSLMFAISLAVAAIPEALQTIVTIVLAVSTEKMAKENAVIKDIKAIETLGNIDIICTDKTGTITQNKMIVNSFYQNKELNSLKIESLFGKALVLCNESLLDNLKEEFINTDEALINYFKNSVNIVSLREKYPKLKEIPFSSDLKRSFSLHQFENKKILFCKGASEEIVNSCSFFLDSNSNIQKLNNKNQLYTVIDNYTRKGLRVIGVSYKETNSLDDQSELIFLGFVMLYDPPKEGVKEAINDCFKHHVKPVMITGDHLQTALSIARQVDLYKEGDLFLTGSELANLSDEDFLLIIDKVSVYARVNPTDKIRIVEMLQKKGHSVCMVGDGVNDAPALKKADVGVSMGLSGTEVSKEASEVILLDDNYNTIVSAIKRGRKVYANIQNAILFLIAGNMAGIFLVLYVSFLNLPTPFAPVHLLFINLINDSLPAIAIGIDERKKDYLYPRNKNQPILSKRVIRRILVEGFLIALASIAAYYIGLKTNAYHARTCVFITISISRLFYSFNCRGRFSLFKLKKMEYGSNKVLWLSIIAGFLLVNILLFVDALHPVFAISNLSYKEIIYSYILAIVPVIVIQVLFVGREIKQKMKTFN